MSEFKEYVKEIIAVQDAKIVKEIEEELQPISLQIKYISSKHSDQAKQCLNDENYLDNMSNNNKINTNFDTSITKNEEYSHMKFDKFKAKASTSIDMKLLIINSNKYPYFYVQPSNGLIKFPLIKSPEKNPMYNNSPNIYHP